MFAAQKLKHEAKNGTNYKNKHIYFHITIISKIKLSMFKHYK